MKGADGQIVVLYVGSVVPDTPEFHTRAFSRAGSMFQENLLHALAQAGVELSRVISVRHLDSFPRSREIWVPAKCTTLSDGTKVHLLSFFNISPLKQIWLGVSTAAHILQWGWRNRRARSRVVYAYNLTVPPGIFTLIAARLVGATTFVSINDVNLPGHAVSDNLYTRLDFALQRVLIPRFDGHVVVADSIMEDFAPGRDYVRVEGGVTEGQFAAFAAPAARVSTCFNIVSVGALNQVNGIDLLVKAFVMLESPNLRLRIAGKGPLEPLVADAARRDSRIEYCGLLDFDGVLELYRTAHLLVNLRVTGRMDTRYVFPSKVIEYLASGVPVLTTRCGHVESEMTDFVFMIQDETPEAVAGALRRIAGQSQQALEDVGRRARDYVHAHKMWDKHGVEVARYIATTVQTKGRV